MTSYQVLASTNYSTVVSEYETDNQKRKEYQSEAELEKSFIEDLVKQGYEYLPIHCETDLVLNLRRQLERLNGISFTDHEWEEFFRSILANRKDGIREKAKRIQEEWIQVLYRDDGSSINIRLIDKKNIHNNYLQVINQYEEGAGSYQARYDVTVLVNGFPFVHIELKRRGVPLTEAFRQIKRYQRDSFWASTGLYEYVQIFIISNGTHTKYYSNTTRDVQVKKAGSESGKTKKVSDAFKFTMYWADAKNRLILDLVDFTKTFFERNTLLNILTKYCVFTSNEELMVMRPYQIAATERILNRIEIATNYKKQGTIEAGGYIWHTTGSGKTLTSFKTAQLVAKMPEVDKVLFVVDRKDLDYQTMKEYEKFQKGAVNSNKSAKELQSHLEKADSKIIVTTIQKLNVFISKNPNHEVMKKSVVFIFDECHRSQFGEMHGRIVKNFKKYYLFGFTGTPICVENTPEKFQYGKEPIFHKRKDMDYLSKFKTTAQVFGDNLHTYSIMDAIRDENVLPFRIDYVKTMELPEHLKDSQVYDIDRESALKKSERIDKITDYLLEHFDQKTRRAISYSYKGVRKKGFNSILAVDSIPSAMRYYEVLQRKIKERRLDLKIATIYSFNPNEEDPEDFFLEEGFETEQLSASSRDFLHNAIIEYNGMFGTNFDTSSDKFENYYKDLSEKMKRQEIDLLIVVNMFLTGFDAPTLNTLWVDKNLKYHGLIQAFSRTNRILNDVKSYGNIICFRNLEVATEKALALFSEDKSASSIVLLKSFRDYYYGYVDEQKMRHPGYKELIEKMLSYFPLEKMGEMGETQEKEFISLYGAILKLNNILVSFDEFHGNELISEGELQDYQSLYLDLHGKYRSHAKAEKENINDDIVFEIELVKQVEVNIDYILELIQKKRGQKGEKEELEVAIQKVIDSSLQLRSKKDLITQFIQSLSAQGDVHEDWRKYLEGKMDAERNEIITEYHLKPEETRAFLKDCFQNGYVKDIGTDIDKILPPLPLIGGKKTRVKKAVIDRLQEYFDRYYDLW